MRTKRLTDAGDLRIARRLARIGMNFPRTAPWPVLFAVSLAFFTFLVIAVELTFRIFFETNDDVGPMMIAHGFGLAATPSPAILISNVLEGKIIEFIGEPFGFVGYGIYTMSCLVIALAYIHATIAQLTLRYFGSLALIIGFGLRAIFAPQFTVTAGILATAAVLALIADTHRRSAWQIIAFTAFAIASFCMRAEMFYLVMIVSVPLLLKWPLKFDFRLLGTLLGVALCCILLTVWDALIYHEPSWQAFESMNAVRALFTDYGLADRIPRNSPLLTQVGLTALDIELVSRWWFIGIPSDRLYQLVSLVGPTSLFSVDMTRIGDWLRLYTNASTYTVTILTVITFLAMPMRRTPRTILSFITLLSLTFIVVAAGRSGVSRIVYPCLFLLGVANVIFCTRWRLLLSATILILPFTMNHFIDRAEQLREVHDSVTKNLASLTPAPVHVIWGGEFPLEALYRPLEARRDMPDLRLYGLGVGEFAPFALAYWNGSEAGFIKQLTSPSGLSIFALAPEIDLLGSLCEQKLHGRLSVQDVISTPYFRHQRASCRIASAR